jgi:hypothetical protein
MPASLHNFGLLYKRTHFCIPQGGRQSTRKKDLVPDERWHGAFMKERGVARVLLLLDESEIMHLQRPAGHVYGGRLAVQYQSMNEGAARSHGYSQASEEQGAMFVPCRWV